MGTKKCAITNNCYSLPSPRQHRHVWVYTAVLTFNNQPLHQFPTSSACYHRNKIYISKPLNTNKGWGVEEENVAMLSDNLCVEPNISRAKIMNARYNKVFKVGTQQNWRKPSGKSKLPLMTNSALNRQLAKFSLSGESKEEILTSQCFSWPYKVFLIAGINGPCSWSVVRVH